MNRKTIIGVTDCSKFLNYERWMLENPNVEVLRLGYRFSSEFAKCDGILLTGGEDVHPRFYGRPELVKYCEADNMDERRDEFELSVLAHVKENGTPLLGICRGLQIANVFFGGTLIPDIPTAGKPDHAKVNGVDRYHEVNVEAGTTLERILVAVRGEINSAHHQAVDAPGPGLKISARSSDGIPEALEKDTNAGNDFFLLVQWHPERMKDQGSPFVRNIRERFLEAAKGRSKT